MKAKVSRLKRIYGSVIVWFVVNIILFSTLLGFHFSNLVQPRPTWWADTFPLAASIITGGLVSFFFYWLVVYVPDQRKRIIIKDNLKRLYREIREGILHQVVFASQKGGRSDLQSDSETIARLMTIEGFKQSFQGGQEADEGFYAFQNQMNHDTLEFRQILLNLEMLAKQIEFVLHNYTMDEDQIFSFFKHLELMLLSLRRSSPGYDEAKPLCGFVYEMFTGWSTSDGYRGYDFIEKMIAEI